MGLYNVSWSKSLSARGMTWRTASDSPMKRLSLRQMWCLSREVCLREYRAFVRGLSGNATGESVTTWCKETLKGAIVYLFQSMLLRLQVCLEITSW